jgi:hypothetical protein
MSRWMDEHRTLWLAREQGFKRRSRLSDTDPERSNPTALHTTTWHTDMEYRTYLFFLPSSSLLYLFVTWTNQLQSVS